MISSAMDTVSLIWFTPAGHACAGSPFGLRNPWPLTLSTTLRRHANLVQRPRQVMGVVCMQAPASERTPKGCCASCRLNLTGVLTGTTSTLRLRVFRQRSAGISVYNVPRS